VQLGAIVELQRNFFVFAGIWRDLAGFGVTGPGGGAGGGSGAGRTEKTDCGLWRGPKVRAVNSIAFIYT